MQSKFSWNPFEYFHAVGLTKYVFMHYYLVENLMKSKF
jgi:hypothetical protein